LLRFTHDALRSERLPAIFNLQRRRQLGIGPWLTEERLFWRQAERAVQWEQLQRTLADKWRRIAGMRARIREITAEAELAELCEEAELRSQRIPMRLPVVSKF
jgi:hypothetical protein